MKYNKDMIEIDKKNRWAIDIALHIPIPSVKIRITSDEEQEIIKNEPLHYQKEANTGKGMEDGQTTDNGKQTAGTEKGSSKPENEGPDQGSSAG